MRSLKTASAMLTRTILWKSIAWSDEHDVFVFIYSFWSRTMGLRIWGAFG